MCSVASVAPDATGALSVTSGGVTVPLAVSTNGVSVLCWCRDRVWTPHVYLVNEQESVVMGADRKDVLMTVEPDGMVVLSARSVRGVTSGPAVAWGCLSAQPAAS
jgi:hypothetical protein